MSLALSWAAAGQCIRRSRVSVTLRQLANHAGPHSHAFNSRVGKLYLELTISYPCLQTHELVRPLASCRPVPLIIDIGLQ